MENNERELYSVGEVAERLGLHVRTVRSYVRDGRLKAVRIGKQYRIAREDFEALAGLPGAASPAEPPATRRPPEVSSIVQIDSIGPDSAGRLSTLVTAGAQAPPGSPGRLNVQTIYDREQQRMKIVILGGAAATADLLQLVDAVVGPENTLFPASTPPAAPRA
jgi:excisionase family DNA binding protein